MIRCGKCAACKRAFDDVGVYTRTELAAQHPCRTWVIHEGQPVAAAVTWTRPPLPELARAVEGQYPTK